MPMTAVRIKKFIKQGKGRVRYDKKLKLHYFQLFNQPSGEALQEVNLGTDPGSTFDGFSIVTSKNHLLNIELIQRPKKGKNAIKTFKINQSSNRRLRRSRLRHRKIRFSNRTKNGLPPTIQANVNFRSWLVKKLLDYFPISNVIIEDVKFNHYKSSKGQSFSRVEQGKDIFYKFIRLLNLPLELYNGYNTKKLRVNSFDGVDLKIQTKDSKSFYTHCLDSTVLACNKDYKIDYSTGEIFLDQPLITFQGIINTKVTYLEKIVRIRRRLTRLRVKYNDAKKYYHLLENGVKEFYSNFSGKRNVVRVKKTIEDSNHPKSWEYIKQPKVERFKSSLARFGGTTYGKSSFNGLEWVNRKLEVSYD